MAEATVGKFCVQLGFIKFSLCMIDYALMGMVRLYDQFFKFWCLMISLELVKLDTLEFMC